MRRVQSWRAVLDAPASPYASSGARSPVPHTAPSQVPAPSLTLVVLSTWCQARRGRQQGSSLCATEPGERRRASSVCLSFLPKAAKLWPGICVGLGRREFSALITVVACLCLLSFPRSRGVCFHPVPSSNGSFPVSTDRRLSNLFPKAGHPTLQAVEFCPGCRAQRVCCLSPSGFKAFVSSEKKV